jgi:RHS repeat-associated protein
MPEGNPLVAPIRDDRTAVTGIAESAVSLAHGVFNGDRVEAGLGGIGVGLAPREWVDRQFYAIVTDLVGTPTELVDADGALAWRARSGLWGRVLAPPDDATGCPLRFPGQYHDPETGHNYNHYRHYDPETARYTSADPVGLTPYRLSDTNPIPRRIRDQYEVIRLGNGTPQIDPETGQQTVFQGRGLSPGQRAQWQGPLEWDVPGTNHRILQRPDGNLGYVLDHDYNSPFLFPAPWYQEGGVVPRRLGGPGR